MGMGYQGFCRFYQAGPATDAMILLTTGSSVNMVLEPMFSTSVWGAGWYNAASSANYADAALSMRVSIDFEMQSE